MLITVAPCFLDLLYAYLPRSYRLGVICPDLPLLISNHHYCSLFIADWTEAGAAGVYGQEKALLIHSAGDLRLALLSFSFFVFP
jgi:hypothetical protein